MVSLVNDELWAPWIGRLLIAFGKIESSINEYISSQVDDVIANYVNGNNLSNRINLAINLAHRRNMDEGNLLEFIDKLKTAQKLLEIRNTIAHNPIALIINQNIELPPEEVIASIIKKKKHIDLSELKQISLEAETCALGIIQDLALFLRGNPAQVQ